MREYKFRFWNKEKKIMCLKNEDDSSNYWDGVDCSVVELVNNELNSNFTRENYEIMQYTGMKDINGTEIYEGDIVAEEGHYVNSDKLVYQKIQWKDNYACWLRGEYQRLTPKNIEKYKITVVGNIYNKSYLLEKPNE